jgi:ribosomal protein S18 acetylase RimI-like enzyme
MTSMTTNEVLPGVMLTGGQEIDFDTALTLFPGSTVRWGHTQVTLLPVPGEDDRLYMGNLTTRSGHRREGSASRMLDLVVEHADLHGVTLCTHPDEPWMQRWYGARGFGLSDIQPPGDGRPFLIRPPRKAE